MEEFPRKRRKKQESMAQRDSENIYRDILSTPNDKGELAFDLTRERQIHVKFIPDPQMQPGLFKRSLATSTHPHVFRAHPDTIRALRSDIFCIGEDLFDSYEEYYDCEKCTQSFDLQFYTCCPFCGGNVNPKLAEELKNSR